MILPAKPFKLRFTIRALLVVMTLLALFLAYHLHWIRQRRIEFAASHGQTTSGENGVQSSLGDDWLASASKSGKLPDKAQRNLPLMLRLLGDRSYPLVIGWDSGPNSDDEYKRLQALFPEADIILMGF